MVVFFSLKRLSRTLAHECRRLGGAPSQARQAGFSAHSTMQPADGQVELDRQVPASLYENSVTRHTAPGRMLT